MEAKQEHEEEHKSHNKYMDVFDCIRTRRSIRKYKDMQVPWDNIVELMQSAKYAPFAGNVMNLKLVVIKDESKRKAIAEACSQQYWMQDAPIHIVVVAEPEKIERYYGTRGVRLYSIQGIAAAIENMLLTAHSLGLGTCWVSAFDEDEIRSLCNLPEHVDVHAVITIGYADEAPEIPPKYRIEHYMFFEKWWGRIEPSKTGIGMWSPYMQRGFSETGRMIKNAVGKVKGRLKKKEGKK